MAELSIHVEAIELLIGIFGAFDENMKVLEKELDVTVVNRESELKISGADPENVELARQVCPRDALDPKTVMEQVGLGARLANFPAQLSGGEQQRVSIARALCKNPALLLCDEPTGALDSKTGVQVLSLLTDVCRTHNATVVIITHNAMIAPLGNRVIHVKNGGIERVELCGHPARVEDIAW